MNILLTSIIIGICSILKTEITNALPPTSPDNEHANRTDEPVNEPATEPETNINGHDAENVPTAIAAENADHANETPEIVNETINESDHESTNEEQNVHILTWDEMYRNTHGMNGSWQWAREMEQIHALNSYCTIVHFFTGNGFILVNSAHVFAGLLRFQDTNEMINADIVVYSPVSTQYVFFITKGLTANSVFSVYVLDGVFYLGPLLYHAFVTPMVMPMTQEMIQDLENLQIN